MNKKEFKPENNYKIIFAVQGEGRGHLSQAIVAYELLNNQGYVISGVIVGGTKSQHLPAYFRKRIQSPVYRIESPGFVRDNQNKAIRLLPTIFSAVKKVRKYWKSIQVVREIIKRQSPDLILNFYEPLIGVAHFMHCIDTPTISIAHQYLFIHPSFSFPGTLSGSQKWMLQQYTRLTAAGSQSLLALSFSDTAFKRFKNIIPCPPFLRNEIKTAEPFHGKHLLVYIVNAGYMQNIIDWHKENPEVVIHCFTDSKKVKDKWEYNETLTFHSLNDQQFLRYMINAAAVVTTAGFESVCEAFYLGKPTMMVPVEGHTEQQCNAYDGERAGAGISAKEFNLSKVMTLTGDQDQLAEIFRLWANQLPEFLFDAIKEIVNNRAGIVESKEEHKELYPAAYSIE